MAREAGVSQPYVVRTFGTKLALFLEAAALWLVFALRALPVAVIPGPLSRTHRRARWAPRRLLGAKWPLTKATRLIVAPPAPHAPRS